MSCSPSPASSPASQGAEGRLTSSRAAASPSRKVADATLAWTSGPATLCCGSQVLTPSRQALEAEFTTALRLTEREQALLRRHFPIVQVQPRSAAFSPFLLQRLAEDACVVTPDASRFLQVSRDQRLEAIMALRAAVSTLASTLEAAPLARAPATSQAPASAVRETCPAQTPRIPRYAHRVDVPGVAVSHERARKRAAHSRRFVRCRWADWLEAASQQLAVDSMVMQNRCSEASSSRSRLVADAEDIVVEGMADQQEHLRPALWTYLAFRGEVDKLHPAWYQTLCLQEPRTRREMEAERLLRKQIQRDMDRTPPELFIAGGSYPGHERKVEMGTLLDGRNLTKARSRAAERLLLVYSRYQPTVGYCQGLNFVAATLLRNLDEHSAFVVFCGLLERLPADLYSKSPDALARCRIAEQERVRKLLAFDRPHLARHLDLLELDFNYFLPRWMTCLFASVFESEATLRVWDHVLGTGGGDAVLRVALAVITRAEASLLASVDLTAALNVLSTIVSDMKPQDVDVMLGTEWPPERFKSSVRALVSTNNDHELLAFTDTVKEAEAESRETAAEDVSTNASTSCQHDGAAELDDSSFV